MAPAPPNNWSVTKSKVCGNPNQASSLFPIQYQDWHLCAVLRPCQQGGNIPHATHWPPAVTIPRIFLLYYKETDTKIRGTYRSCLCTEHPLFYTTGHRPWWPLAIFYFVFNITRIQIRRSILFPILHRDWRHTIPLILYPLAIGRVNPLQFLICMMWIISTSVPPPTSGGILPVVLMLYQLPLTVETPCNFYVVRRG